MIIDKIRPFYTDEIKMELASIRHSQQEKLDSIAPYNEIIANGMSANDKHHILEIRKAGAKIQDILNEVYTLQVRASELEGQAEQNYIDSFKENPARIMQDVEEITAAVEKIDYKNKTWRGNKSHCYKNCYFFILSLIRVQLNGLAFYNLGEQRAIDIVEARTEKFYTKPRNWGKPADKRKNQAGEIPEEYAAMPVMPPEETGDFLQLPNGRLLNTIFRTTAYSGSMEDMELLKNRLQKSDNKRSIIVESKTDENGADIVSIKTLDNKQKLAISFKSVMKRANTQERKILMKIFELAGNNIHGGVLRSDAIHLRLDSFVGEGQYSGIDQARVGVRSALDKFKTFEADYSFKDEKKSKSKDGDRMFYAGRDIDNYTFTVYLNQRAPWKLITEFYAYMPNWAYSLPGKAFDMLWLICSQARQANNARQIAEKGYFSLKMRYLQTGLNLPDENKTKNPKRDIKDAIETSIEQIEETYCKHAAPIPADATGADAEPDFYFYLEADSTAPIGEYLDGKLRIYMKNGYAAPLIDIQDHRTEKIQHNKKIKEKAEIKAKSDIIKKKSRQEKGC